MQPQGVCSRQRGCEFPAPGGTSPGTWDWKEGRWLWVTLPEAPDFPMAYVPPQPSPSSLRHLNGFCCPVHNGFKLDGKTLVEVPACRLVLGRKAGACLRECASGLVKVSMLRPSATRLLRTHDTPWLTTWCEGKGAWRVTLGTLSVFGAGKSIMQPRRWHLSMYFLKF